MEASETFARVLRAILLAATIVAVALLATGARAQNSGTVGIRANMTPVFSAQSTTASSGGQWQCGVTTGNCPVLPDIGQGSNILFFCNTAFTGTIDLEWSPTGSAPFYPVATASYSFGSPDSTCHSITPQGGYFPNLRSTVTPSGGSLSAWYTASSGPTSAVASGIGTNGPTPPVVCDHATAVSLGTASFGSFGLTPMVTGDAIVLCSFTVSFNGATSAGNVAIGWVASASTCAATFGNVTWQVFTTSGTPQLFSVPVPQRAQSNAATPIPCLGNQSGATVEVSISYASVHGI